MTDFLTNLGWNDFFADQLDPAATLEGVLARVTEEHKNNYRVLCELGDLAAELSGRLRYEAQGGGELPAVGDWVRVSPRLNERRATVQSLIPRRTAFRRKQAGGGFGEQIVAANIDTTFIVSSLNSDLNLRRLERYLATAWESGSEPVVVLTKADLCEDAESAHARVATVAQGVQAVVVSAHHNTGVEALAPYLSVGKTCVLLGSSGVGKSTLVNRLAGREILATQLIGDDDTGRHTTTHRQLIVLPGGGMVIDTPGMRELGLAGQDDDESGVAQTFEDIEQLALQCQFSDCRHRTEPRCAIKQAIDDGTLDAQRFQSWIKLQRELAFHDGRSSFHAARQKNQQWKKARQNVRARVKFEGEGG